MGYRGKVEEQHEARRLRAQAWTLQEIADELGVAKSSVSTWVRGVAFDPAERRSAATGRRPRGSDHAMMALFCRWLRTFFEVDESRLRVALYLHVGLPLDEAIAHWSEVTGVPEQQFTKPYRAVADATLRTSRHVHGCATIRYACTFTQRRVMGLVRGLLHGEGSAE